MPTSFRCSLGQIAKGNSNRESRDPQSPYQHPPPPAMLAPQGCVPFPDHTGVWSGSPRMEPSRSHPASASRGRSRPETAAPWQTTTGSPYTAPGRPRTHRRRLARRFPRPSRRSPPAAAPPRYGGRAGQPAQGPERGAGGAPLLPGDPQESRGPEASPGMSPGRLTGMRGFFISYSEFRTKNLIGKRCRKNPTASVKLGKASEIIESNPTPPCQPDNGTEGHMQSFLKQLQG